MTTLGERIKAYRSQLGINQKELAERASSIDKREKASKWGQSRIANYEVGARTPDLEDIAILAKVLNVLPETLALTPSQILCKHPFQLNGARLSEHQSQS